jgi:hypothetical protein
MVLYNNVINYIRKDTVHEVIQMQWTEVISTWLKEGHDDAENLLEYPWDIVINQLEGGIEREVIIASHPKIPFNIEVVVSRHFTNLVINPLIPTDALDAEERMRLYKKLLHLNTDLNLMKSGLVGYDDQPVIQVDLDLGAMSKQEFNDALTLLIVGAQNLIMLLGLQEKVQEFMLQRFKQMVALKLAGGEEESDILDFLTSRGGLEEDVAKEIFNQVMKLVEANGNQADEETPEPLSEYDGPMYG